MTKRYYALLIATGFWAGCAPPSQIVPVPPPGLELRRQIPISPDGEAQALGEQPAAAAAGKSLAPANALTTPATPIGQAVTTKSGLKVETVKAGTGAEAKPGMLVRVNYAGKMTDGKQFDASKPGKPYEFRVAVDSVIAGWHEGVAGMKVGEIRKLTIPPNLAYGSEGKAPIPPNSTLLFDIELVDTK